MTSWTIYLLPSLLRTMTRIQWHKSPLNSTRLAYSSDDYHFRRSYKDTLWKPIAPTSRAKSYHPSICISLYESHEDIQRQPYKTKRLASTTNRKCFARTSWISSQRNPIGLWYTISPQRIFEDSSREPCRVARIFHTRYRRSSHVDYVVYMRWSKYTSNRN